MKRLNWWVSTIELVSRISVNPAETMISTSSRVWQAMPAAPEEACMRASSGMR